MGCVEVMQKGNMLNFPLLPSGMATAEVLQPEHSPTAPKGCHHPARGDLAPLCYFLWQESSFPMGSRMLPALTQASPCLQCPTGISAFQTLHGCAYCPSHISPDNPALARRLCVFKEITKPPVFELYQTKIRRRKKP